MTASSTSGFLQAHKCPVLVYYHGGSFNLDSATMFPDKFILERYVDSGIVFAIPAYRLGVFGQFYLGEQGIVPANLLIHGNNIQEVVMSKKDFLRLHQIVKLCTRQYC